MLQFRFAAETDTGLVRDNNEDSAFAGPYLLAVADGVGGAAAGEVASATTTYVVSAMSLAHPGTHPLSLLQSSIEEARGQVRAGVEADPARHGMATTLTAILTDGQRFGLAHVGDSRAYLLRDGGLVPLTSDHTLVQAHARHRPDHAPRRPPPPRCATSCCRPSTPSRSPRPT